MQAALQNQCYLNAAAAAKIMNQGYATPADLMTLTEDGVKDLVNHINHNIAGVNMPFCAIDGLLNFQYWAILTNRVGIPTPQMTTTRQSATLSKRSDWIIGPGNWPTQMNPKNLSL